ncbi:0877b1df-131e-43d1-9b1d-db69a1d7176a [Sclerotinia trifoliorum]|uniref:0877b1df-131e-43d1-9b1d-db69a1d7176a n=1 Tax=Sclerotinia trifoliorum TaxID=28548 RepID=A0A8H2ZNH6_9HELO|nr:0877b1df-131e-43d1-9b1d-db69a1d7176a [Sclerotinia trifoliorum]
MSSLFDNPGVKDLMAWLAVGMRCYFKYKLADEFEPFGEVMRPGVWRSMTDFMNAAEAWNQWPVRSTFTARMIFRTFRPKPAANNRRIGRLRHMLHRNHDLPSLPAGLVPEPVLQELPKYGRGNFSVSYVDNATNAWNRLIDAQIPGGISAGTTVLPRGDNASDAVDPWEGDASSVVVPWEDDTSGAVVHWKAMQSVRRIRALMKMFSLRRFGTAW